MKEAVYMLQPHWTSPYSSAFTGVLGIAILGVLSSGCGDKTTTSDRGQTNRQKSESPIVAEPVAANDDSPHSTEYVARGMPALDRPWASNEYVRAAQILQSMGRKQPRQLPRHNSPQSGSVFARICSPDNLTALKTSSVPAVDRLQASLEYMPPLKAIMVLYIQGIGQGVDFRSELVEILGMTLRFCVVAFDLMNQFAVTIPRDDPKYQVRMEGLAGARAGLAVIVNDGMNILSEREKYSADHRQRILKYLSETLPALMPDLPQRTQVDICSQMKSFAQTETDVGLQEGLKALDRLLSEISAKNPRPQEPVVEKKPDVLKEPPAGTKMYRLRAGMPNKMGWYEANSTLGKFSVVRPRPFNDYTVAGKIHCVGTKTEEGVTYLATKSNTVGEKEVDEKSFKEFTGSFFANDKRFRSRREIRLGKYPGAEIRTQDASNSAVFRFYLVHEACYYLSVEYPTASAAEIIEEVDQFLDSLKIEKE